MLRHQKQRTQHLKAAAKTLRNQAKAWELLERVRARETRAREATAAEYDLELAEGAGKIIDAVDIESEVYDGLLRKLVYNRPFDAIRAVRVTRECTETWYYAPDAGYLPWGQNQRTVHGYLADTLENVRSYVPCASGAIRPWRIVESAGLATLPPKEVRYTVSLFERDPVAYGVHRSEDAADLAAFTRGILYDGGAALSRAFEIPESISRTLRATAGRPRAFLRPHLGTTDRPFTKFASYYALCCLNHLYHVNERSFRAGLRTNSLVFRYTPMHELIHGVADLDRRWDPMWRIALGWDRLAGKYVDSSDEGSMYLQCNPNIHLPPKEPVSIRGMWHKRSAIFTTANNKFADNARTLVPAGPLRVGAEKGRPSDEWTWYT